MDIKYQKNEVKNNLERERNEWRTKFSNKNREYEDEKEKREKIQKELDKLKDERLRETRENASEKSTVIHQLTNKDCFSEDTGLEVEALNGEPAHPWPDAAPRQRARGDEAADD